MNKKTFTLNVSLIPLVLIILLIIGAGYFLTEGEIQLPKLTRNQNEIRRIEGYPLSIETDQDLDKKAEVLSSKEELNEFLSYADPLGILTVQNVDFEKESLLAVSSKTRPYEEDLTRIKRVRTDKNDQTLKVELYRVEPGETCTEEDLTAGSFVSFDFVTIKKTDWKIEFETTKITKECN